MIVEELETKCGVCFGYPAGMPGNCTECAGTGLLPTEAGTQLLKFLSNQKQRNDPNGQTERRWFATRMRQAQREIL